MEQKLFSELRSLYVTTKERPNEIRIRIRMRDLIAPDALRHAVDTTMERYPYFCVELQKKDGQYIFAENHRPVVITNSLHGVALNSEASNYRGGLVPYGYRLEHQGRVNKKNQPVRDLVIDEKESLIVQEVFHKITSDGWGTNRIANWLNARGIPTKHGDSFWRGTSVRAVIRNPIYTGRIRFGDDLSEPFEHLRLIDDALFEQCDRLVREKAPRMSSKRTSALRSTSRGLLTGVLFCGSCGERMCFNHNRTIRSLADGTKKSYERDVYRCYRKISDRRGCTGRSTYSVERIEGDVLDAIRTFFERIKSAPTQSMLQSAGNRTKAINEEALARAEATLKKAQSEMTALEEEAVKALTGESKMDVTFINNLIPKRRANLEKAMAEVESIRTEIENEAKTDAMHKRELQMILTWAETFETAPLDTKRAIISAMIERITVHNDYTIDIQFRMSMNQFLGKVA